MNKYPPELKWSSFGYYAFGESDLLITPDPVYLAMGNTPEERQRMYLDIADFILDHDKNKVPREELILNLSGPRYLLARYGNIVGIN